VFLLLFILADRLQFFLHLTLKKCLATRCQEIVYETLQREVKGRRFHEICRILIYGHLRVRIFRAYVNTSLAWVLK
jgi:hypothetical protein